MLRILLISMLAIALSGCDLVRNTVGGIGGGASASRTSVEINDTRFRARARADGDDKRNFLVTVTPVASNPEAAVAAAEYQATRYCLLTFGGSDKTWVTGPDTPLASLPIDDNTATLTGRCTQR